MIRYYFTVQFNNNNNYYYTTTLFRDPLFVQQLLILHTLFLWLQTTDLDKQGL
jgi:hypothetical protein